MAIASLACWAPCPRGRDAKLAHKTIDVNLKIAILKRIIVVPRTHTRLRVPNTIGDCFSHRRRLEGGRSLALDLTRNTSFASPPLPSPSNSRLSRLSSPPRRALDLLRERRLPPLEGRLPGRGAAPGMAGMYIQAPVGGLKNIGLPSLSWAC